MNIKKIYNKNAREKALLEEAYSKVHLINEYDPQQYSDNDDISDIIQLIITAVANTPPGGAVETHDEIEALYSKAADLLRPEYEDLRKGEADRVPGSSGAVEEWVNQTAQELTSIVDYFQDDIGEQLQGRVADYIDTSYIIGLATGAAHQYDERDPTGQDEDAEGVSHPELKKAIEDFKQELSFRSIARHDSQGADSNINELKAIVDEIKGIRDISDERKADVIKDLQDIAKTRRDVLGEIDFEFVFGGITVELT